jgi:acetyl/propionyl-CoA carboxylase alpha subunit
VIFDATVDGRSARVEVRSAGGVYTVLVDGRPLSVAAFPTARHFTTLIIDGRCHDAGVLRQGGNHAVSLREGTFEVTLVAGARGAAAPHRKTATGPAKINAPMPGKIVRIVSPAGQDVRAGECLVVMEAMKMENEIRSPRDGRIKEVLVKEGQAVESGALLILVE